MRASSVVSTGVLPSTLLAAASALAGCAGGPSEADYAQAVREADGVDHASSGDETASEPRGPDSGSAAIQTSAKRAEDDASPVQVLRGKASYYADSLAGNATASGEPYDPEKLTAAHRELPFGTRVRVARVDDDRAVVVRINDRGPFGNKKRIIDVSRAAAEELGMIRAGVVDVRVEVLPD